jgi:tetratricopeptide (TPR) repeat protein
VRAGMESLTLYRAAELDQDEAALRINMALTYLQLSSRRRAAEHLKRARQIADRTRAPRLESEVAEAEAQLAYSAGDMAAARDRVEATLRAVDAGGSYLAAVGALTTRARMARDAGDQQVAEGAYSEAAALLRDHGAQARLRDLLAEWGEARTRTGDLVGANRLYAEALGREARPR